MSATAFIATNEQTVLFSDGIAINTEGLQPGPDMVISEDRIASRNSRKCHKLTESIGVLWMGQLTGFMDKFAHRLDTSSPEAAAQSLAEGIRKCIDQSGFRTLMPKPWFNVNVHVFAYQHGTPMYYHIVKKNGNIECDNGTQLPDGAAGCLMPLCDNAQQLFNDLLKIYASGNIKETGEHAFRKLISEQSLPLGGQIFIETLTPANI